MGFFIMLPTPPCLLFFFLCLKTAFLSSLPASSFSTTQLCSHEEALALLQFKTSFSINNTASYPYFCNYYYNTKPYSKTESWKEGIDCCSWDGVSCDNVTGHVIALDLSCSFLYGTFPSNSTLFLLKNLQTLNLALNDFRLSKIPSEISQFTRLKHLDIYSSRFSGRVPREIAYLRKLVSLNLSNYFYYHSLNELILETTTFRNLVQNLSEVRELVLDGVDMSSVNPHFFMNLSSSLTTLSLFGCELRGNFPNNILRFPNLKIFELSGPNNNLSLRINVDANFTLPELTYFLLSSCNLSEFPNFLRHSNSLQTLVLSKNSLHGNIPKWICEKDNLRILDLSHNNLMGKIPNCLPKSLSVLNLQANNFDGNIPFKCPEGCALQNLNLHANRMDGPLPRSLVNCSMLEVLDVGNNDIEDTFPQWLESLPELQVLVLRSNKFNGFVQSTKESPSFPKLRVLDLSNNDFLGPLPVLHMENFRAMMDPHRDDSSPEYMMARNSSYQYSLVVSIKGFMYELQGILTIFTSIDLSHNKFGGEIPDVIGKFSSLKGLNLSHNNLTGPISPALGNLTNLEWLDLSSNELIGKIPDELVSLTQLSVLNLSNNHLVGRVPQGKQFNTFGNDSYEGNLGLCGIPLSKSCDEIGTQEQPRSSFQEEDEFWRFGWRVMVLGYGCGVVSGLLMGYQVIQTGKPK